MNDIREKRTNPHTTDTSSTSSPTSRGEILAGVGLFLFLGLVQLYMNLPYDWGRMDKRIALSSYIFAMLFIIPAMGYAVGWVKGFPRWSYPYVGVLLLISLYFMNVSTPGVSFFGYEVFGRELWGWRSWIPLGIAALVALIISRSFRPIMKFFTNGWQDWTLFTFGMFGWMPLLVWVGFDEIDNLFTMYFTVGLNMVTILSSYAYMRSTKMWQRVVALSAGIVIPVVVASLGSTLYWLEHGWVSIPGVIKMGIYIVLVMFAPVFIGILRYADNPIPTEWES